MAPALRASDKPIALACFGFVTFMWLRPLSSVPAFIAFISCSTLSPAAGPYLVEAFFVVGIVLPSALLERKTHSAVVFATPDEVPREAQPNQARKRQRDQSKASMQR